MFSFVFLPVLVVLPLQVLLAGFVLYHIAPNVSPQALSPARAVFVTFRGMLLVYAALFVFQVVFFTALGPFGRAGAGSLIMPLALSFSLISVSILYRQLLKTSFALAMLTAFVQLAVLFAMLLLVAAVVFVYYSIRTGRVWF